MTFALVSTPSDPTSNSYLSVVEADEYFYSRFGADTWFEFSTQQKQQLLVTSTRDIDLTVFGGSKTTNTQALQWPRALIFDNENRPVTGIPRKLMEATCELALWKWSEGDRMLSDVELQQVDSFKAGPLDIKVKNTAMIFPSKVDQLLKSIGPGVVVSSSDIKSTPSVVRFSR